MTFSKIDCSWTSALAGVDGTAVIDYLRMPRTAVAGNGGGMYGTTDQVRRS